MATEVRPDSPTASEQSASPSATGSADTGTRGRGLVALGILLLLAILAGLTTDLGTMSSISTGLMLLAIAQGWNVLGGYGGYLNLGVAAFFGVGSYGAALLFDAFEAPLLFTLPAAALAAVGLALIVGGPSLRLRGPYFAIITLVIGFLIEAFVFSAGFTKGALGIYLDAPGATPRATEQVFYFGFLFLAVVGTVISWLVERSRLGLALRAIREDEDAAPVLGIQTMRVKLTGLSIGAALFGLCGGIQAYRLGYIEPGSTFDLAISIDIVLMVVVGGKGYWQGPLVGVPVVVLISEVLRIAVTRLDLFGTSVPTEFNRVVLGALLVTFALAAPRGIVGRFKQVRGRRIQV